MPEPRVRRIEAFDAGFFSEIARLYQSLPSSRQSVFNEPIFLKACWQTFAGRSSPFAVVLYDGGRMRSAAFFRHRTMKLGGLTRKTIVPLVFRSSDFTPFLIEPGREKEFLKPTVDLLLLHRNRVLLPRLLPEDAMKIPFTDRRMLDYGQVPNPVCFNRDSAFEAVVRKKSLRRRTNWFERNGELTIQHLTDIPVERIRTLAQLHVERWAAEGVKSKFTDSQILELYERLAIAYQGRSRNQSRMVLTDVRFNGETIAMHLGFSWGSRFLYQIPAVSLQYRDRWPGEVLMKALFEYAIENKLDLFDLGFGDEWYKSRFANDSFTYQNVLIETSALAAVTFSAARKLRSVVRSQMRGKDTYSKT